MTFLDFLSALLGWVYTFLWSASFYPQPLLNFRRKSTTGSTVDFPFINSLGFAAYFVSSVAFMYSPAVLAQYAARHHNLRPTVQINDIAFALHAMLISLISLSQYIMPTLWGFDRSGGTRPSRFMVGIFVGCLLAIAVTWFIVAAAAASPDYDPTLDWGALDIVYVLGYVKLLVTIVKFSPQVYINWRNQCTTGWSIGQVLLDLAGGVLSDAQQCIDSYVQHDWSGITGNPVKFGLANVSIIYDVIFVVQHYWLYPDRTDPARERRLSREDERLLPDEERRRRID